MAFNPMMALGNINPSLVGYTGGWGKAAQALGGSMEKVGQAKMDLEEKTALKQEKKDIAFKLKQGDIATNKLILNTYGDKTPYSDDELSLYKPDNLRAIGKDGWDISKANKEALRAEAERTSTIAALKQAQPTLFDGLNEDQIKNFDYKTYMAAKETKGPLITLNDGSSIQQDKFGNTKEVVTPKPVYVPGAVKTELTFDANGRPQQTSVNTLTKEVDNVMFPLGTKTEGQKGREEGLANSLITISAGGKETRKNQVHADTIRDVNVKNDPKVKVATEQEIAAQGAIDNGGLPIKLSSDPKIAALQKTYANKLDGGVYVVPQGSVSNYMKQFPSK